MNLYAYVHNDPLRFVDPSGEATYHLSLDLDVFIFVGLGVSGGIYFNPGLVPGEDFELGFVYEGGAGFGGDVSAGVSFGRTTGPASNLSGSSVTGEVSAGPFAIGGGVLVTSDNRRASVSGSSSEIEVGASVLPVGGHLRINRTGVIPLLGRSASDEYADAELSDEAPQPDPDFCQKNPTLCLMGGFGFSENSGLGLNTRTQFKRNDYYELLD